MSKILIEFGPDGRPSGEADVYFSCHEHAAAAMSRDRQYIGETAGEPLAPAPADGGMFKNIGSGFLCALMYFF